jgi:thioesterase domain-containing protein
MFFLPWFEEYASASPDALAITAFPWLAFVQSFFSPRVDRGHGERIWSEGASGAPAIRNYELRPYPGKATLFVALNELGCNPEPANAWAGRILGGCDTRLLPGTHRSILTRPQVTTLAQELRQRLLRNVPAPATSVVA